MGARATAVRRFATVTERIVVLVSHDEMVSALGAAVREPLSGASNAQIVPMLVHYEAATPSTLSPIVEIHSPLLCPWLMSCYSMSLIATTDVCDRSRSERGRLEAGSSALGLRSELHRLVRWLMRPLVAVALRIRLEDSRSVARSLASSPRDLQLRQLFCAQHYRSLAPSCSGRTHAHANADVVVG